MIEQPRDPDTGRFKSEKLSPSSLVPFKEIGLEDATGATEGIIAESRILAEAGLDPAAWELTNYRVSEYGPDGDKSTATRWSARKRAIPLAEQLDATDLLSAVASWGVPDKPRRRASSADEALAVFLSDWQIGGVGPGGNTQDTISRVLAMGQAVIDRTAELRTAGRTIDTLHVFGLGDIVEGCTGFYANQAFSVDLDNMGQIRIAYHLLSALIRMWAPEFSQVYVHAIGGNHGETREQGKSITGPADNKDVLVFEVVRDILAERAGYEHVRFHLPEAGEMSAIAMVGGKKVGYTHGHLFRSGANSAAKAEKWWAGQMFGLLPVRDADILVSAHFHHFSTNEFAEGGRSWFQTPAMDNGSAWYTEISGKSSAPGTLTMRIGRSVGIRGWDDLAIL